MEREVQVFVRRTWFEGVTPSDGPASFCIMVPEAACTGRWSELHAVLVQRIAWLSKCQCSAWNSRRSYWMTNISRLSMKVPSDQLLYVRVLYHYTFKELVKAAEMEFGLAEPLSDATLDLLPSTFGPPSVGLVYTEPPHGILKHPPKDLVVAWRSGYAGMIAELGKIHGSESHVFHLFGGDGKGKSYQKITEDTEGELGTVFVHAEWDSSQCADAKKGSCIVSKHLDLRNLSERQGQPPMESMEHEDEVSETEPLLKRSPMEIPHLSMQSRLVASRG